MRLSAGVRCPHECRGVSSRPHSAGRAADNRASHAALLPRWQEHSIHEQMGKLVWLASYPKSGNTWLRAFLHNYLRQPAAPHDINRLDELTIGESEVAHFARYDARDPRAWSIADVQRLRRRVHRDFMTASPTLVFVKTHNASLVVDGVPLLSPDVTAGAIYVVRDPRDVAVSYAHHLGRSLDETIAFMADPEAAIGGDGKNVYERLSSWSVHVHFWTRTRSPQLRVVRFEDLLADHMPRSARWFASWGRIRRTRGLNARLRSARSPICGGRRRSAGSSSGRPTPMRSSGQDAAGCGGRS